MSPLTANDEGNYPIIDWGQLQAAFNYLSEWNKIVKGNEDRQLHFPPLIVLEEIVAVLFCRRIGNDFRIAGGFHSAVSRDAAPLTVTLQIKMLFFTVDGEQMEVEKKVIATLKHATENRRYSRFLTMSDIAWQQLSWSRPPIANILRLRRRQANSPRYCFVLK